MPQQGPFGHGEVRTGRVEVLVHQKVLLLPTQERDDFVYIFIKIKAHLLGRFAQRLDGTDQWSLVVQCLTRVGDEYGRDTERIIDDEGGRRGIPGRIAACLEGVAQTPVGETGGIRLLLYQQLTAKLFDHTAEAIQLGKGVMLLGRTVGQRLKPVRIMGDPFL